jgi:putative SOS response-associated peptidase YedK
MCTNFTPIQKPQWVKNAFGVDLPLGYAVETYPGFAAPILVQSRQTARMACGLAKFGLIPAWAKDEKISRHTYNARSETVAEKPSYRSAWRQRQFGLVLVENFFEPSYETGGAVRWRIGLSSGEPFGIACLWDRWTDPVSGELVVSFSMLTVNADEHPVMKQFHKFGDEKRTPVIIAPELHSTWLGASTESAVNLMSWQHMPPLIAEPAPAMPIARSEP